ncbi:hypothetical protein [Priestia megaterium]|uniref:hypothetical protein n=1 Tax=Priestia megaterium TaxID=1404 RepID=UPI002E1AD252|nr:hypothetical protein [Priestia megaterium]
MKIVETRVSGRKLLILGLLLINFITYFMYKAGVSPVLSAITSVITVELLYVVFKARKKKKQAESEVRQYTIEEAAFHITSQTEQFLRGYFRLTSRLKGDISLRPYAKYIYTITSSIRHLPEATHTNKTGWIRQELNQLNRTLNETERPVFKYDKEIEQLFADYVNNLNDILSTFQYELREEW